MSRSRTARARENAGGESTGLVLSDAPERRQLRGLRGLLEQRRDEIAEVDLEIETLRDTLATFESTMHARLAAEHERLRRIEAVVRQLERWAQTLDSAPREKIGKHARRLDARRAREVEATRPLRGPEVPEGAKAEDEQEDEELEQAALPPPDERLKAAYRGLARRFHPDLARTEEERLQFGQIMARINLLYREGDLARLEAMAEQAKGGEIDDAELADDDLLRLLGERLVWFDSVLESLREERAALERSPTCELWRDAEQGRMAGRDVIEDIRRALSDRANKAFGDVEAAVRILEVQVDRYNREQAGTSGLTRARGKAALERLFDPFADKKLVRLSLEALAGLSVGPAAQRLAGWIEHEAPSRPAILRLLLLTYVSELSPFPLAGLESYDDLTLRFDHLASGDQPRLSLEKALVEADDLVEYGIRRATPKVTHMGLRFRDQTTRDAVPVALRALPVRRELKRVLAVLGEYSRCGDCGVDVFAVPLYRTRGLDDLRANLCPFCGRTLSSYWMPKGKDVQAVLNTAYLDLEIITEWTFRLARASVAMQLLPIQMEKLAVGDLKERLFTDLFDRYELGLDREHVRLLQDRAEVDERVPLEELDNTDFTVRLTADAPLSEADALETLRHRIRNRFRGA